MAGNTPGKPPKSNKDIEFLENFANRMRTHPDLRPNGVPNQRFTPPAPSPRPDTTPDMPIPSPPDINYQRIIEELWKDKHLPRERPIDNMPLDGPIPGQGKIPPVKMPTYPNPPVSPKTSGPSPADIQRWAERGREGG